MVRDRLQELQQARGHSSLPRSSPSPGSGALALTELSIHSLQSTGDPFLDHCAQMRQSVEEIDRMIRNMLEVQEAILGQTVVRTEDKHQLDTVIGQIRDRIGALRPKMRQLERDLQEAVGPGAAPGARHRMRRNHAEQLRRRLNELLELFSSVQEDYRQRVNRRVRRQLELAGEHLSAAEVDQLLANKSEEIFFRRLSPISFAAQMALEDAESRHTELLRLERSIGELSDCFRDMLQLVHSQGTLVDNIESNVLSAADYAGQARLHTRTALTYKRSADRMRCALVLALVLGLLVLFLVLIFLLTRFIPSRH